MPKTISFSKTVTSITNSNVTDSKSLKSIICVIKQTAYIYKRFFTLWSMGKTYCVVSKKRTLEKKTLTAITLVRHGPC